MSIGTYLDDLRMRGKFNLLLVIQTLALVLVASLGWSSVNELQQGQNDLAKDLAKTAALSRVLNGMNVFRTVHVSMIGGPPIRPTSRCGRAS